MTAKNAENTKKTQRSVGHPQRNQIRSGPMTFLPGSNNAADRFARCSFLLGAIPTKLDAHIITAVPDATY